MGILILSFLGGVLTIFSPCVLPVVPFVFARADQPFRKSGLPMLVGMGLSFALFGALSATGGAWVVHANRYGRAIALVVFAILGATLLFPRLAERLTQPLVQWGGRLQQSADARGGGVGASLVMGASIGLLWAPCAGPILGLVLAGAALGGSSARTFVLLVAFGAGAASSLGVAITAGNKVLAKLKKGLGAEEWIRRALGLAVMLGVIAIALGFDTQLLAKLSYLNTSSVEKNLVKQVVGESPESSSKPSRVLTLAGASAWLNSPALSIEALRGRPLLIDFWTYSCINCLRTLPHVKAWAEKYGPQGLVVIGVHAPEFAFEKDLANVERAVRELAITYPVAIDNEQKIWNAFQNEYWPAHYFIDREGKLRAEHFGEGDYEESERIIQALLAETGGAQARAVPASHSPPPAAPRSPLDSPVSPETYLGYERAERFASRPALAPDQTTDYFAPSILPLDGWSLAGSWNVKAEHAMLTGSHGTLKYRFRSRDVQLVLAAPQGRAVRFRVRLDGKAPGASAYGADVSPAGEGSLSEQRLYRLLHRPKDDGEHTITIEFFDAGAEAYAFTFD